MTRNRFFILTAAMVLILGFILETKETIGDEIKKIEQVTGLKTESISYGNIVKGIGPDDFLARSGAAYKPSHNEDPAIPAQCWIETSYGTQNACKYCHTNYLAEIEHGNAFPIAEDQILFNFPSPNLNAVHWKNIIYPHEVVQRLRKENIPIPEPHDTENLNYVRTDNWRAAYRKARSTGDDSWNNLSNASSEFQLFPALNPNDLFPFKTEDPTSAGKHGYVDNEGFIRNKDNKYTGWRAVNFFPYGIFTPLTGSVSGIYIRLPEIFRKRNGKIDIEIYKMNLELLEKNIKNIKFTSPHYYGKAGDIKVKKGFFPMGTEFAHPLHYVDLNADGETGSFLDGLNENKVLDYEFPGTRSKRVKEIRYMYKWKDVGLKDIGPDDEEDEEDKEEGKEVSSIMGKEGKGWIDNDAGWILSAYIENRKGELRPQTTEELLQCKGCHSSVGITIDAVWSYQRKLPGNQGWGDMDYGLYKKSRLNQTRLQDYYRAHTEMGELEYFYYTVVGADLFGVMPQEIKSELTAYAKANNLIKVLELENSFKDIFDDEKLKMTGKEKRKEILQERAKIMKHYALSLSYLYYDTTSGKDYIKGSLFYPTEKTMRGNIANYRRIVLDQSFNLGKNTFGTQPDSIPFTFLSDGTVINGNNEIIPLGAVIDSRPWGKDGIGTTPTGIVKVNSKGEPVDAGGKVVDIKQNPEKAVGHVTQGGTFETQYNSIITGNPVKMMR